jgi:hypothetical protein
MRCDMHKWMNDIEQNGNPQHTSTTAQSDTTREANAKTKLRAAH